MKHLVKKTFTILLAIILTIGIVSLGNWTSAASTAEGGYGSNGKFLAPIEQPAADAIPISNRMELEAIKDNLSGSYYLTQDIDLSGAEWMPIGYYTDQYVGTGDIFMGVFDGQGYVIRNMTITKNFPYRTAGLFGVTKNAVIKNLGMEQCDIDIARTINGHFYIGSIAGYVSGDIGSIPLQNCYSTGSVSGFNSNSTYSISVGGIAGSSYSVSYCYNNAVVSASHNGVDGGIYSGGIVGRAYNSSIEYCYNSGEILSTGRCGGIVGLGGPLNISECYNLGSVSALPGNLNCSGIAGGIIGCIDLYTPNVIENCYNQGTITAYAPYISSIAARVGGIVSGLGGDGTSGNIINCYNAGDLSATSSSEEKASSVARAGGIAGQASYINRRSKITNCITLSTKIEAIGTNHYTNMISSGDFTAGGNMARNDIAGSFSEETVEIFPISDFYNQSTYEAISWDFDTIWKMPSSGGYPIFQWQDEGDDIEDTPTKEYIIRYPKESNESDIVSVNFGAKAFSAANPSTNYNNELALVAAALTACATDRAEYLSGLDSAYARLGFRNDRYFNYAKTDEMDYHEILGFEGMNCFSIASRAMTIDGKDQLVIAIIMRGTGTENLLEGLLDWQNGGVVDFYGYKVYDFYNIFASMAGSALNNYLLDYGQGYADSNIQFLIAGHSLGGAAANLLAARLKLSNVQIPMENIYAYTFGALNTLEWPYGGLFPNKQAAENQRKARGADFSNIFNLFNLQDTFGPKGKGVEGFGVTPAYGDLTSVYKFGKTAIFDLEYPGESGYYKDHNMPCYIQAVEHNMIKSKSNIHRIYCPVNIEVYDSSNMLVGRIRDNMVDETISIIPMYVEGDRKYFLLPADSKYSLKLSAFDNGSMEYYLETVSTKDEGNADHKGFINVDLVIEKQMYSAAGGIITIPDTRLYIVDDSDTKTVAIQMDGTEIPFGLFGDVNQDGVIDLIDPLLICNYAAGRVEFTDVQLLVADVNGDGSVKLDDALLISNYVAGRFEHFPVEEWLD